MWKLLKNLLSIIDKKTKTREQKQHDELQKLEKEMANALAAGDIERVALVNSKLRSLRSKLLYDNPHK